MITNNFQNIKGLIFDYGGTIDSRGNHWANIIREGYQEAGIDINEPLFRDAYVFAERALAKTPYIKPEHNFLDLLRIKIAIELSYIIDQGYKCENTDLNNFIQTDSYKQLIGLNKEINIYLPDQYIYFQNKISNYCYEYALSSVNDAIPVLDKLKQKYPIVLVSNFYGNINSVLKDFNISSYFDSIIESAVVGIRKPNPEIFSLGVQALNLDSDRVIVIGDSYSKDIAPSEQIGCHTIWIKGSAWDDKENEIQHPFIIKELNELIRLLNL